MGARGERIIHLEGREVTVLYTNRALVGAEKRLGRGIVTVMEGFSNGSSGLFEAITLLHVGMEASRVDSKSSYKPVTMDDAYEVVDEIGFTATIVPVVEAIADVISYSNGAANDPNPL